MRKRLWQLHSWLGLTAGLGLLVIGLTGSLLVFRDELEVLVNPAALRVEPVSSGRLSLDRLLVEARAQLPEYFIVGWVMRSPADSSYADLLYVIRRGTDEWQSATLNPFTGRLLTSPHSDTATLTGWLLELHYAFFTDHAGMLIVGAIGVILCTLGITGVWIYREFWKHVFTFRWGRGARILFSDLHKFVGITSVVFNLILGFTGAYWNLTHVIGEWINGEVAQPKMERAFYSDAISPDALVRDATERFPGYHATYLDFPSHEGLSVTLYGNVPSHNPLRGPYGNTIEFDAQTGAFKSATDIRTAGLWAQFVDMFTPLHYGTFGGLPVKILWSIGGLAPGVLSVSGFMIWNSRRRATRRHPPAALHAATAS